MGWTPAWHTYEEILLLWVLTPPVGARGTRRYHAGEHGIHAPRDGWRSRLARRRRRGQRAGPGPSGARGESSAARDPRGPPGRRGGAAERPPGDASLPPRSGCPRGVLGRRGKGRTCDRPLASPLRYGRVRRPDPGHPLLRRGRTPPRALDGIDPDEEALASEYSDLGPRRSIAVLVPSFAIAQAAIFDDLPMSFNELFVSTIIGSGLAAGRSGVRRRKILYTGLAWVGSPRRRPGAELWRHDRDPDARVRPRAQLGEAWNTWLRRR